MDSKPAIGGETRTNNLEKTTSNKQEMYIEDNTNIASEKGTPPSTTPPSEPEEDFKFTAGKFMAILSFTLGYISDRFITAFVGATLRDVNADIGPSPSFVWMALGQPLGTASLAPICGRLGDIYGRRNLIIWGNVIAIIGCVIAAVAPRVDVVIAGTVLIGISGAFRQIAWSSLGELVPKSYRALAFGLLSSSLSLSSSFGPIIAFSFIDVGYWRAIYWLPFGLDIIALVLTILYYHPLNQYIHEEGKTTWDQIKETDFLGCFLFIAGLVLLLLGVSFGGATFPWASAGTLAPLIIGAFSLAICGVYEAFNTIKWPIFPPSIFRNIRGFTLVQVAVFIYGMSYYATGVLWPGQVRALYTRDIKVAGWYSGASGYAGLLYSPIAGYILTKIRRVRYQTIFYVFTVALISGTQAIVSETSNVESTILVFILFAAVTGVNIASMTIVQSTVRHEFIGIATGITCCVRSFGGSIGQVVYTSILNNRLSSNIATSVIDPLLDAGVASAALPAIVQALQAGQTSSAALGALTTEQLEAAIKGMKAANVDAYQLVYLVTIAFGVTALGLVYFVADVDHLLTSKVDIKLKEGATLHAKTDTGAGHIIRQNERSA